MNRREYTSRINYIKELIRKGAFYSPAIMAHKFECSEKTVRNMINELREDGFQITFCRKNKRYFIMD
jgi:biotin operon repressor